MRRLTLPLLALFSAACIPDLDGDGSPEEEDCDDNEPDAFPGNLETCDGIDNDCDGEVDEDDAEGTTLYYRDKDADGYGLEDETRTACEPPVGWAVEPGDCDDEENDANPGSDELCDGIDNDCDGTTDEGDAADAEPFYADLDEDSFGDPGNVTRACSLPENHVLNDDDCDDNDALELPGAQWWPDSDGDGFGDRDATPASCARAAETDVADATDCDDSNPDAYPGAPDTWYDGIDADCQGDDDYDQDGDGFRVVEAPGGGDDCIDTDAAINPGAAEAQDGIDNDCDTLCDEDFINPGDLVISEIMWNPVSVLDEAGEWFEVHNVSETDIPICEGWRIEDFDTDGHDIAAGWTISAGSYVVFAIEDDASLNGGLSVDYEYTDFQLANSADEVRITLDGVTIDEVAYDDDDSDWARAEVDGASVQLSNDTLDAGRNDSPWNWCTSEETYGDGDLGTPGAGNIFCVEEC
jgi:hypothetical protein